MNFGGPLAGFILPACHKDPQMPKLGQTSQQVKHVHSEMQLVFESSPRIQAILAHHGDHRSWRTICGFRIPPFWTKTMHNIVIKQTIAIKKRNQGLLS